MLTRRPLRPAVVLLSLAALLSTASACFDTRLIDRPHAEFIPSFGTIAVGARRDVVLAACRTEFTIGDALFPVITAAVFSSFGRIDALAALPESFIPGCTGLDVKSMDVKLDGEPAFGLETSPTNGRLFTLRADSPGKATLRATLDLGDQTITAEGLYEAKAVDHVTMRPFCYSSGDANAAGVPVSEAHLPVDTPVTFSLSLYAGDVLLSGYGYYPVEAKGLAIVGEQGGGIAMKTASAPGPATLTSPDDPGFKLDLQLYDLSLFDKLDLHSFSPPPYVGQHVTLRPLGLIDGKVPCLDDAERSLVIETPDTCSFLPNGGSTYTSYGPIPFEILADADGKCRVRAELVGTKLSATFEVDVARGWELLDLPSSQFISPRAIWGSGPKDVYFAGTELGIDPMTGKPSTSPADSIPAVLHFDGSSWIKTQPAPSARGTLIGVWGSGPKDVFAVGANGTIVHLDEAGWAPLSSGVTETLTGVWGSAPNDVFAVGYNGTILHYDGSSWSPSVSGVTDSLLAIWGSGPADIYAVGVPRALLHYDGSAWQSAVPASVPKSSGLSAIWGSGPADVWVVGNEARIHFDGAAWSSNSAEQNSMPAAIWGSSANDVFEGGRFQGLGGVQHFDGAGWTNMFFPFTVPFDALWGSGPDDVYAVYQNQGIFHYRH